MMELLTLEEFAEESGLSWVLEEPETYYRYEYDKMTYEEWSKLFG